MKGASQPFQLQKKLIIHIDVNNVLKITANSKDLYVYDLCSNWIWGKNQKNSKEDPQKVTGWKLSVPNLSIDQPEPETITYKQYLDHHLKPNVQERQKLLLGLSKGAGAKVKAQIQKNIKNITLPKTLYETLKQVKQLQNENLKRLLEKYSTSSKYEILPAFYKYVMWLKKTKRQFALVIHNKNPKDNHADIINQLNLFFTGDHPLFNGKNGTPLVKLDGSKGCKNFAIEQANFSGIYKFGQKEYFSTFGSLNYLSQKDIQLFKQNFKSLKQIKLCEGSAQSYSHNHTILAISACIYQINPVDTIFIDPIDYNTQQIYFTSSDNPTVYSCLDQVVPRTDSFIVKVNLFQYLKDVDFLIKSTQNIEKVRQQQIQKIQRKDIQPSGQQQAQKIQAVKNSEQSQVDYLKRTILPVLQGAVRQVDLFRPEDPLGFIALYCLKNKERIKITQFK